jgi:hypothetical protein
MHSTVADTVDSATTACVSLPDILIMEEEWTLKVIKADPLPAWNITDA